MQRRGLRHRILLWFLVLSLAPLFASNTLGYLVTRRIIESQVSRHVEALAEVAARHVATEVEQHQLYLDAVVAGNTLLVEGVSQAAAAVRAGPGRVEVAALLHEHLDKKLAELRPLSELSVLDTGGLVIASTNHDLLGTDWSDAEIFRLGRSGRYFSEDLVALGGVVGPVYRLATPIRGENGDPVAVLAGTAGFESVQGFLRIPSDLAGDVRTFLTDSGGYPLFVSHPQADLDYGAKLTSPLLERSAGAVARYSNYQGVQVLGTSVSIPGRSWKYIVEVPVTSAFGQLHGLAQLALLLQATFALLLVAAVWVVARSIVAPVRHLATAAERIRSGELGVEVQIDRRDELGELGRTFNQMSQELQASAQRIHQLHDQEMRRAAQLASVGELASGIAHEIKNPLVGVSSGVRLLVKELHHHAKSTKILNQMGEQLHRIESAITDLLRYARPKAPRLMWTDPELLVDRVIALVSPQADAAGVHVERLTDRSVGKIKIDPELMTQGLVNLALNGIQAMGPGGLLTLSTGCVSGEVHISVSDTGTGILDDQLATIFRPFYTTKHQGTGLGLTITRGIIERHGGRLEVQTEVGVGSTFTLALPPLNGPTET
jgi:signal transduction histidine kinase